MADKGADLLNILMDIQDRLSKVEAKLDNIDSKLKSIEQDLAGQRNYTDRAVDRMGQDISNRLDKIEGKIEGLEARITELEKFRSSISATSRFADKLIGFIIGALSAMAALLALWR